MKEAAVCVDTAVAADGVVRETVAMTLRIGYKASAEQFNPRELVELAVQAEQVGLDSVMISDNFQPYRHTGGHAPFSMAWLAAVGERTERVLLGTSVMAPTFRYNPAVVAQAYGTLACLYPGRVMLGVGTGEALNEVGISRLELPEFKERFARMREAVALMRELLAGERITFKGDYYQTHNATVYDRPDRPVPIYIAAGGPVVARYAGRSGDGFICTSGKGPELYRDKLIPAVDEGLATAGRATWSIDRMIEIKLSYDPDPRLAMENTRFCAPLSLTPEQKHGLSDPMQIEAASDALSIEQVASRWIVASDPETALAQIKPYLDLGFNHLVFHAPGHDQSRFLASFAADVVPGLRTLMSECLGQRLGA